MCISHVKIPCFCSLCSQCPARRRHGMPIVLVTVRRLRLFRTC
ncbi:hypothetical protein BLSMQ_3838 [Brevibacterium aurantiacum]|uniref:Uncharacterized protein n=1 Tax=Brevibacterium aurantiacum TaxID=273384 RepID=A0A1D7W946_BREAU|nr:hypothetical protein BLSMQ_3838 [Brevibacterium aurantiacum]